MNSLESIVPPLELCKKIPAGKFEDSALVWNWARGAYVGERRPGDVTCGYSAPAPTLAEILEALDDGVNICIACVKEYNTWKVECEEMPEHERDCTGHPVIDLKCKRSTNPAAAALRLWLEVEGVK